MPKSNYTIQDMKKLAISHGGRCLSDVFQNRKSLLLWECSSGHTWTSAAKQIMGRSWCPECAKDKRRKLNHTITYATPDVLALLDGLLLGDGCLHTYGKNSNARLSIGFKYKDFADYVCSLFSDYQLHTKPIASVLSNGNTWIVHRGSSLVHPDLTREYHRWYSPNKKIPKDMRFTPSSILMWYLCDGSLRKRKHHSPVIVLSTESFDVHEIDDILLPGLNKIFENGFYRYKKYTDLDGRDRFIIRSHTKVTETFLSYVGGRSPVTCYDYKFNLVF